MKQNESLYYRLNKICKSIWDSSRTQLHLSMRHFDTAIYSFVMMRNDTTAFYGTDGDKIFYNEKYVIETYERGKIYINRAYVHMMLHCLFGHLFHRNGRLYDYWNLACDIVVESMLDEWKNQAVHLPVSGKRMKIYHILKAQVKVLTAERVYETLLSTRMTQKEFDGLLAEFEVDDHSFWREDNRQPNQPPMQQRQKKWDDISKKVQMSLEQFADDAGTDGDTITKTLKIENRKRYEYSDFLRKFSVLREEPVIDLDSFDYTYYMYGLTMYGNMPFIEPQEWKETKKIRDFVIAIDTSMSCSGELIQEFLGQTYQVLTESDQYFSKVNIHILQCDDKIREDTWITSTEQMEDYMEEFEVKGYGGTDFRPVFEYVEQLKQEKKLQDLKGLLYFTDGNGIYPKKAPDYDTAFVFVQSDDRTVQVPPWAIKLVLEPHDLMKHARVDHREDHRENEY
ncbi:MAG: VWA-like domain-containing protein [Lachnospiraceae bacterium]|nr:VWA-like domain-containing protein [Lachnospiraceae bacterium]